MDEITNDDLGVLVEALEAWETKDSAGEMMGDMFSLMLTKEGTPEREQANRLREEEQAKRNAARRARKDRSVMLRAKLIAIRQSRDMLVIERAVATGN